MYLCKNKYTTNSAEQIDLSEMFKLENMPCENKSNQTEPEELRVNESAEFISYFVFKKNNFLK